MITTKFLVVLISSLLIGTICLTGDEAKETKKLPELADVVVGVYYSDVISDSKGSSRSDVTG
ncbi:MAG: hypothetical protein HC808_11385 [Candidatus Competibacteraceae bacterium]|nr:hypothetical protein [Candidatus Competibacteraceae bacterium]